MRQKSGPAFLKTVPAVVAVAVGLLVPQSVFAASKLCRDLEAQLVSVQRSGGENRQTRRYDRAIRDQERELKRARLQARRIGCAANGFVLFGRGAFDDRCDPLITTIKKMELNLAKLENTVAKMSSRASIEARRNAILAKLDANRCREETHVRRLPDPIETTARRDYNLMDKLFGRRLRLGTPDGSSTFIYPGDDGGLQGVGTYRTLCVRTCDGYYFPISYATSSTTFARDEQACQQMCPGVNVQLYSHRVPDEEPEDMVSMIGEPYAALPTAFAYRDPDFVGPKDCACNPAKDYAVIAGEEPSNQDEAEEAETYVPTPLPRPDPGLDPESAQNLAGKLTVAKIGNLLKPRPSTAEQPRERQIRVVGPAFLPDPEQAIDLKSPDRNDAR